MTEVRFEMCIRKMNNGDRDGLREIYEEYVSYIYGIVMQMIGSREN
ncbi:MAG: RNA polymerase subunit sigma-70, partial [Lachnospiraceae bacterium]|nr:RNA polymerase subunit sigma-70 [Lachnospiraceae bacterium]